MFEYLGWVTVRDDPVDKHGDNLGDYVSRATVERVRQLTAADDVANDFQFADFRPANAEWHLTLSGFRNHRQQSVIELWRGLAVVAPGSYGLLYVRDDEAAEADNAWTVLVMARGIISERADPFLSPFTPDVDLTDHYL